MLVSIDVQIVRDFADIIENPISWTLQHLKTQLTPMMDGMEWSD